MTRFPPGLLLLALLAPITADATLISFEPSATTVDLGANVAVDIVATPEAGELIGGFDFNVAYDPGILQLDTLVFGPSLNDDPFFCALLGCRGFADAGGLINLFEVSLVFPLTTLQTGDAPVVLATLFFDAVGVGTSDLVISGNIAGRDAPFDILGDDFGVALPVFEPGVGSITVNAVDVDEPSTWLLMLCGLLTLRAGRRRAGAIF